MLIAGQSARDAQTIFYLLITSLYLSQNNFGRSGNAPRPDAMSGCIRDPICPLAHLYGRCSSLRASDQVTTFILAERRSQSNLLFSLAVTHCPPVPGTRSATLPAQPAPIPRSSPSGVDIQCRDDENRWTPPTTRVSSPRSGNSPAPAASLGDDFGPYSPIRRSLSHAGLVGRIHDFWTSSRERGRLTRTQRRTLETIRDSPRIWATPG